MADLGALLTTGLAVLGAMSQLRRLWRSGVVAGVSLPAAMVGVASELGWMAYGTHESLWSAVPIAIVMTMLNALAAFALVRCGASRCWLLVVASGAAVALAARTAVGGWALRSALLPRRRRAHRRRPTIGGRSGTATKVVDAERGRPICQGFSAAGRQCAWPQIDLLD